MNIINKYSVRQSSLKEVKAILLLISVFVLVVCKASGKNCCCHFISFELKNSYKISCFFNPIVLSEFNNSTLPKTILAANKTSHLKPISIALFKVQFSFYDLTSLDDNSCSNKSESFNKVRDQFYHSANVNLISRMASIYTPVFNYASQEKYQA
ncbi:MAG: hypothetical protein ACK44N_07850 [Bacteroidota bacterium]